MYIKQIENKISKLYLEDNNFLTVETTHGEKFEKIIPRRLFPNRYKNKYISLIDENEKEITIINNIENLSENNKEILLEALNNYYFVPIIQEIKKIHERNFIIQFEVVTNYGICEFKIFNPLHNAKLQPDFSVIIRDTNDNRYIIPDSRKLNKKILNVLLL